MIALDCTFRDGGYYNNWEFDLKLANKYLKAMEKSKIHAVEVGFRSPPDRPADIFAKVSDEFIEDSLYIPNIEYFGVMVNTGLMNSDLIKQLFKYADESPINLVRAATHFKEIDLAEIICKDLKNLGYTVACNLMQATTRGIDEIEHTASRIESWNSVDVLYIADSLGGMNHDVVNYVYKAVKEHWTGLTGFHGHNNKGQSLNNTLEAIDIGVDWVDGTMLGMGRGPGNTETEYLLAELNKRDFGGFKLDPVYELVLNEFLSLKRNYGWGPSLAYYLAAEYNIHPIYIQRMTDEDDTLKAIYYLRDREATSFDENLLKESLE